jgi:hypothetical protein
MRGRVRGRKKKICSRILKDFWERCQKVRILCEMLKFENEEEEAEERKIRALKRISFPKATLSSFQDSLSL